MAAIVAMMLTGAVPAPAPAASSPAEDAAAARAAQRGHEMFRYDRAAWVTTDDLMARLPRERATEIGGWIVTPSGDGLQVDYFGRDKAADRVIYSATVRDRTISDAKLYPADSGPALSNTALRMARALAAARVELAKHADWPRCSQAPFNTIVLPPQTDGTTPVYFLTPQTATDHLPFGGHYEIDMTRDGQVQATRTFTTGCFDMPLPLNKAGEKPEFLFVTHLLDAQPTEIHVFQQYALGIPLMVAVVKGKQMWMVQGGQLSRVPSPEGVWPAK